LATERPIYIVHFQAMPNIDAIKAVRALLKFAGRRLGLKAVKIIEQTIEPDETK
jgi:hypothetical protein